MSFVFSSEGNFTIYVALIVLGLCLLSLSFIFAFRVRRFASSKKSNPQDEGLEKWNDHFRQVCLNLFLLSLATASAITVFNLQRRQQAIFSNRDMADKAMATVDDIVNQQLESLRFLYMLDLRLPSIQNDNEGFDIFRNAMIHASSEQQVDFSIADIKKPFSINDLKIYDRKLYGYISKFDIASFSALTYSVSDIVEEINANLKSKRLDYGLYTIDSDDRAQVERYIFQMRSLSAEYIVSLCALYSRIEEAAARSDLGGEFQIDVTPDLHFADKLDFSDSATAAYFDPQLPSLRSLRHRSSNCADYTEEILKEGNQIIPFLRTAN